MAGGTRHGVGSLPYDATTFVGRRQATAEIRSLLAKTRLVTLTGAGGVGKSRLARHVSRKVERAFANGVRLVELAELQDASLVGNVVGAALELPDTVSTRDPIAALADFLADQQLLLLLDNCEHLLDPCARLVSTLLSAAPELRVLATSREPLRLAGEHVWTVQPLTVPVGDGHSTAPEAGSQYEALALFEERASAVVPAFALNERNQVAVSRLCRRLEGLPLAIELAAVWLRTLSIDQVLERMEDRYRLLARGSRAGLSRHQTLRATVDWSFNLCTELERTLWKRLSVFVGGIDLEAAEYVCVADDLTPDDVVLGLAGLVDKSVLSREESGPRTRYLMLETIREYGLERLAEGSGEVAVRRRHRDHYLWLAERAEAEWFGPSQRAWLDLFRDDQGNVRSALEFCLTEPGEARAGQRLAGALAWYWVGRANRDGRYWLDRALAADAEPSRERAKALWTDGWVAAGQGDAPRSVEMLRECIDLASAIGDENAVAYATQWIGTATWMQNQLPDAATYLERALHQHQAAGELNSVTATVPCQLGMVLALLDDVPRGITLCEESVNVCAAHGEYWTHSWAQWNLAVTRWSLGDSEKASEHAGRSLQLKRAVGDQLGIPFCVEFLAWTAMADGDAERAATLLGVSDKMWEPIGAPLFGWGTLRGWSDHCRMDAREALQDGVFEAAYRRGERLPFDAAVAYALGEALEAPPSESGPPAVPTGPRLTRRERQVAELVADGRSNKEIAARLVISQRTAESHVEHILVKLGFTSRTQIATWILEHQNRAHG